MIVPNRSGVVAAWRCMAAGPAAPMASGLPGASARASIERPRILIVEDSYFAALTIENTLTDAGYDVLAVVDSGEAALQTVAETRPDLVLMDVRLAGDLDGIDTAIALRDQGIVSLFASAHSDANMKARAAAARPAGWIVKPFSDGELVGDVRSALRGTNSDT